MTNRTLPVRTAAAALAGPVIWAAHFIIVYASESVLCRVATGAWHTLVILATTAIAVVALIVHGRLQARRLRIEAADGFLARTALTLDGLSLVAILLVSAAGLALPACR